MKNHAVKVTMRAKRYAESTLLKLFFPGIVRTLLMLVAYIEKLEQDNQMIVHYLGQIEKKRGWQ